MENKEKKTNESPKKRETMYQRLLRISKELQLQTNDPKFAWS